MSFRYSLIQKVSKKIYRRFFPVPKSPYTVGEIKDICAVNLVPPEVLKTFFGDCVSLLRELKGEAIGDYLEFGVFNGSSLSSMHYVCKKDSLSTTRLFGFDAFQGLPEGSENEDDGVWKKGFYSCSFEKLQECLEKKSIHSGEIKFIHGWYEDTLNDETIKQYNLDNLGIVFIDCDTYSSSKAVFQFIAPLIKRPLVICCDDWKLNDLDIKGLGEYKSFNEFADENPQLSIVKIKSYNRKSQSFLIHPR